MTSTQVNALKNALQKEFGGEVDAERINVKGRYRLSVISPKFEKMGHLNRQDAIWKVVDATLPRAATLDVSLVLAYAPSDLQFAS
jgi:hypothetical protein